MRASELQAKDVINIVDGRKLGAIGDLDIDLESGLLRAMIIPGESRFFGLLASGEEVVIPWTQIVKIGSDVVLVDMRQDGGASGSTYLAGSRASGQSSGY
ncbi:MAG: YlmC/YmxH family sporulation protein [Bacilli bacterium]